MLLTPEDYNDLCCELYDEALEYLLQNPGEERLPYRFITAMNELGLDPNHTEMRLLNERDSINDGTY